MAKATASPDCMSLKKHTDNEKTYVGPIYLDCNATTPIEPEVADLVSRYMLNDYGNSGTAGGS